MQTFDFAEPMFAKQLEAACTLTKIKHKALRSAVDAGDKAQAGQLTQWFLTAEEPRIVSAVDVAKSGKVKPIPSISDCLALAKTIDFLSKPTEKVRLHIRKKNDFSHRTILNFGFQYRTSQEVLRTILSAYHRPQPFQYTHQGPKKAILRAIKLLKAGNCYFVHLDIKKFYPSFKIEKLVQDAALGGILPHKTLASFVSAQGLECTIDAGVKKIAPHLSDTTLRWEARRGIPTGSCLSSIVAPMMVSRLPLSTAVKALLINYEDDFLLLASSEAELEQTLKAFLAAGLELPGGRFTIKEKSRGCLGPDYISFLGHVLSVSDGSIRVGINSANYENFQHRFVDFKYKTGDYSVKHGRTEAEQSFANCVRIAGYLFGWLEAFSLCGSAVNELKKEHFWYIQEELANLGKTFADLPACKDPSAFVASEHFEYSGLS